MTHHDTLLCDHPNALAKLQALTEHINKVFFGDFLFKFKITHSVYSGDGHQNGI